MVKVGLFLRLEAKPGKEELEKFLLGAHSLIEEETETAAWFFFRLGLSTYGLFDAFPSESGREAHLSGKVSKAFLAHAPDLLSEPPTTENIDILAAKL
ncbi:hypothetical protein SAMN05444487_103184 [Marininema mesophilum]|uniref:Quinol monooxygenase YgiN n=1 Tax=Marininema mesophilum TaxID=1048340 RepID=A0A1H2TP97_9BACL|nr:antibiotic biosynthesis monooxygenase [Marininema mesophilum]SDW45079.1 hypothetical protein SAMN05444487_103184 [Marininema mesophilum]